jgi:8-oxo-dGTP pyrophosphatase MutT (NUDIX family)
MCFSYVRILDVGVQLIARGTQFLMTNAPNAPTAPLQASLLACLQAIRPPADIEEWVQADKVERSEAKPSADYSQGVYDVLAALGVLTGPNKTPASPMAFYFVQSLMHTIAEETLTAQSWKRLAGDVCGGIGARLVDLIESNRLACSPEPTPMRVIRVVTAVIKARRSDGDVYLMQYDDKAEQFQPIGGKQEASDASNQAALIRELCEELSIPGLISGEDCHIHPIVEHALILEVSNSLHVVTQYDHSFYHLTNVRFPIHTDDITRWISASELAARKTRDGYAITSLFEDHLPGVLPTLGSSISGTMA